MHLSDNFFTARAPGGEKTGLVYWKTRARTHGHGQADTDTRTRTVIEKTDSYGKD